MTLPPWALWLFIIGFGSLVVFAFAVLIAAVLGGYEATADREAERTPAVPQ